MKRRFAGCFLVFLLILSLTACQDSVDIIISEAPTLSVSEPIPEEITIAASEAVTDDVQYIETEKISTVTTSQTVAVTTEIPPRPGVEELLVDIEQYVSDLSFEPIEETEEAKIAKQFIAGVRKALWLKQPEIAEPILDKYIDNSYLKNYIAFNLKLSHEIYGSSVDFSFWDISLIEAVEQEQAGDITYILVNTALQYYDHGEWAWEFDKDWVGIRNEKVVDFGRFIGDDEYKLIGIEKTEKDKYGCLTYPFPPERNPWDNMEDIKKLYDSLKAQGYDIEMKDYPLPD